MEEAQEAQVNMPEFDPEDPNVPEKLRNRILEWHTDVPRLQYSQYGPIDKYLNIKFPGALVKPQGLIRPILQLDADVQPNNEDEEAGLEDIGNISIDSTGQYVLHASPKRFPDFVVASYYDHKPDRVRMIVEIGSLYSEETPSARVKEEIQEQLSRYMAMLGIEGGRWGKFGLGVAILGTEVSFSRVRRKSTGKDKGKAVFCEPGVWRNLYDGTFVKEIDRVARKCRQEDEEIELGDAGDAEDVDSEDLDELL